ncbi:MAG TPA: hypothetical protein VHO69_06695 [Phototrophicaceae bacterium]|nr:hypothetical protein [Phototrophicaceae bacterium]
MPNGGLLPSCFVCERAEKTKNARGIPKQIYCKQHSMSIAAPIHTFCPDLIGANNFTEREQITGQDIYTWIEITYGIRQAPGIPMYYQEYAVLAPIAVYRGWSEKQKIAAARAIDQQKKKELDEKK